MRYAMICCVLLACGPVEPEPCETYLAYPDSDGDGFGDATELGSAVDVCLGTPGYSANALDCGPDDARAHPGQTEWQAVGMFGRVVAPSGAWDFNCDGLEHLRWIDTASCTQTPTSCYTTVNQPPDGYWRYASPEPSAPPGCGVRREWVIGCRVYGSTCLVTSEQRVQACL